MNEVTNALKVKNSLFILMFFPHFPLFSLSKGSFSCVVGLK